MEELDHPDRSVTTKKIRDEAVTEAKLATDAVTTDKIKNESVTEAKLADKSVTMAKVSDELKRYLTETYVRKAGDTIEGDLTFSTSKGAIFSDPTNSIMAKVYVNSNGTLDIGVNGSENRAIDNMSLCSMNKPRWYNKNNGSHELATLDELMDEVKKYLPLKGGTMTGNITFANNSGIAINRKAGGGAHTITDGGVSNGQTNLDLGNKEFTTCANLCCYQRPGWYGKDKQNIFKPFLFDDDMTITSGTINDGQTLPLPDGFREDECHWLLSINNLNTTDPKESNLGGASTRVIKCYRENRRVICGVDITIDYKIDWGGGGSGNPNRRYTNWLPGTANYVCIARKRV